MFEIHSISISIQRPTPSKFRFVETVRNECQIFISNLASEKKIHREQRESSLNSAKYENTLQSIEILSSKNLTKTRKSREPPLISSERNSSRLKFLRTAVERRRSEGKQKKKKKERKKKEQRRKRGIQRDDHPAGGRLSSSRLSPLFQRRNVWKKKKKNIVRVRGEVRTTVT